MGCRRPLAAQIRPTKSRDKRRETEGKLEGKKITIFFSSRERGEDRGRKPRAACPYHKASA